MNSAPVLRPARAGETGLLTAIALAGKAHWGYPAAWLELWRPDLTITAAYLAAQIVVVAEADGNVEGFAGLLRSAEGDFLEHLWLRPALLGRGIGRALFAEAARQAQAAGITELLIKSDPNAEGFYLKQGAVRIGVDSYELPGNARRGVPILRFALDVG